MPQTKFVLRKAFANKIRPIVVINKIDRPDARPNEVLNEIFDTFVELGADDQQLDFPYIFASGKDGYASHDPAARSGDIGPLFDLIVRHVPGPEVDADGTLQMLCTSLDFSEYVGRIAIGRIVAGVVRRQQKAVLIKAGGVPYTIVRATQFFEFLGGIADSGAEGDTVRLSTAPMRPMAADDVAAGLAEVAVGAPLNDTVELAGPEKMSIAEFVGRFMAASGDRRKVVADPQAPYYGAKMGSLGIAPTGNIDPEHRYPSMFEPIHGSEFDIMGKGLANPVGTFWSVVMMLEHLGEFDAAKRVMQAIEAVTADKSLHTGDLGGTATTAQVTAAVCAFIEKAAAPAANAA